MEKWLSRIDGSHDLKKKEKKKNKISYTKHIIRGGFQNSRS